MFIFSLFSLFALSCFADVLEVQLQLARERQVTQQGYPEPQNYVVRVGQLPRREAKTERVNEHIVTTIDRHIDPTLWPSYIHHEYAHACQIMMGGPSASVFMDEASATLQEILAFGEHGAWHKAVAEFQSKPHIPPFVDLGAGSKFEYGGALFLLFLEQNFGNGDGRFVQRLWSLAAPSLPHVDNAGWVRIVETETAHDFADLILAFADWRLNFPGLRKFTVASRSAHELFMTRDDWPMPLGCVFLYVPLSEAGSQVSARVESESLVVVRSRENISSSEPGHGLDISICDLDKDRFLRGELDARPLKIFLDVQKVVP
jgi:hypothetical protein